MDTILGRLGINRPNDDKSVNLYDYMMSMKNNRIFFESVELKNVINGLVDSKYKASGESFNSRIKDIGSGVLEVIRKIFHRIREFFIKVKKFFIEKVLKKKIEKAETNNKELRKTRSFPLTLKVNYKLVKENNGKDNSTRIINDLTSLLEATNTITNKVMYPFIVVSKISLNKKVSDSDKKAILNIDIGTTTKKYKDLLEGFDHFNRTFQNEMDSREVIIEDKATLEAYLKYSESTLKVIKESVKVIDGKIDMLSKSISDMEKNVNRYFSKDGSFNTDLDKGVLNKMKDILTTVSTNVTKIHDKTMKTLKTSIDKVTIWHENIRFNSLRYANVKD